jgi:hypothetical protein
MPGISDPILIWNERLKLVAAFLNAIGLGMIGFAVLKPLTGISPIGLSCRCGGVLQVWHFTPFPCMSWARRERPRHVAL